ncbi:FIGL1 [Scenedesmus sp. PABB004]|nr:FIGL1 [Scenedesmus sp. PABB004]
MQEVARYLLFSAAAPPPPDGGGAASALAAQLHALGLALACRAEAVRAPAIAPLWAGLAAESSALLAAAGGSSGGAEARGARLAAAGAGAGPALASGLDVSRDGRFAQLLDQGQKAKQQLAQVSAALQAKLAAQAAAAQRAHEQPLQHDGPGHAQERKREADGSLKQQQLRPGSAAAAHQPPEVLSAAAARWSGGGGGAGAPPSSTPKRLAAGGGGGWGSGGCGADPIEVDSDSGGSGGSGGGGGGEVAPPFAAARGGDAGGGAAPGGGGGGFMSARAQLVCDLRKKGQHQQAAKLNQAIEHQTGGGGGQAGGAGGGEEGPLSARTLEMLGAGPDGELPPELAKHDPRLIEQVCNDVLDASGGVSWDDIAGLATAKHLVKEVVVWPMLNPQIFTGPRAPPKGILLFGPPGTGKTLIGKAIASNIRASFFSISASSLTSKWIGEGEKMVKTLFAVAGCLQPSVIFIDEIDSLLSARKAEGEHEASRRLKTELLVQMEGCDPSSAARRVLLVGATNRPEELDEAARRRMPKQLYIPLPCGEARRAMVSRALAPVSAALSEADLDKIVSRTGGYSGSDMRNLIQEACQGPVRDAVAAAGEAVAALSDADLRPVVLRDFQHAARAQRASVTEGEVARYEAYNDRHGAKYSRPGGGAPGDGGGGGEEEEEDW